ncbi:DUF4907 domain-containing protein [Panacibacter sp. DH6]|uniref:DUF4907 domain-containing protein n=1 Tax=Panacibacter microcysteis TaxID=2793269 RepID=A0A931DXS4_9BACT|nr:DUF4907 domain-containing protein [Panacibacter microcysteis]MBG9374857.1 DUF4907 domain-containing protein [Panacibacter microcysteis]
MRKTIKGAKLLLLIAGIILASCTAKDKTNMDDRLRINAIAVPAKKGWGYEIYVDNKLFIKQDHIPAISGNHSFAGKADAIKTANMVIAKMKEGKKPVLTTDELTRAGIHMAN